MSARPENVSHMCPEEAIKQLVGEYGGQIYSLGLRFCGNAQDAEDLVQEVFLQAFRAWHSFDGRSSPKTWLFTIAARACQRMHRPRACQPARIGSLEELLPFGEARIAVLANEQDDVTNAAIRREARERGEQAIAMLPDEFRVPLILKEIVGLTVPEVAEILGLEQGTVKSRVHRARLRIRAEIDCVIPRREHESPPPAYPVQVCLDLLNAKQEALDRGVPFEQAVICERCLSVFASLDLTQEVCRDLAKGELPDSVFQRLSDALKSKT